jgi:CspA family cold shock protein
MAERLEGIVSWFNNGRGIGFIFPIKDDETADESIQYFFHWTYINMDGFKTLAKSQRVTFEAVETPKGIQAREILILK